MKVYNITYNLYYKEHIPEESDNLYFVIIILFVMKKNLRVVTYPKEEPQVTDLCYRPNTQFLDVINGDTRVCGVDKRMAMDKVMLGNE